MSAFDIYANERLHQSVNYMDANERVYMMMCVGVARQQRGDCFIYICSARSSLIGRVDSCSAFSFRSFHSLTPSAVHALILR